MKRSVCISCLLIAISCLICQSLHSAEPSREEVLQAMKRAATFYRHELAVHGGYVYYYSLDGDVRWGEGAATATQIWVQPPGTPTVGQSFLSAYEATKDQFYLDSAVDAARALVYGQLQSGGWTNSIDFNPQGKTAAYRNGKGRGKDNSTLDDGISQSALTLLMSVDQALAFKDKEIHESASIALTALLKAQFPNGGFPQVWTGPSESRPVMPAEFPDYDWRTENRIKAYWTMYTLNDNLASNTARTLIQADEIYHDERAQKALRLLGDFLVLAQLPAPQPAWAQQYDTEMRPIWARKFEPPAISGGESQDVIETLLLIYQQTQDPKYLKPIPNALAYLKQSRLEDGRLARFYELKTNTPLYMTKQYQLTYDDSAAPNHYGWKIASRLDRLDNEYQNIAPGKAIFRNSSRESSPDVDQLLKDLDEHGRWITSDEGAPLVGQPKFQRGDKFLSSEVFSRNLNRLSLHVAATKN